MQLAEIACIAGASVGQIERLKATGRVVTGYAAIFDELSRDKGGYRELIRTGAFRRSLRINGDIFAFWDHDPEDCLGSIRSGNLELSEDDHGLRFRHKFPEGWMGDYALDKIQSGEVRAMSFGYYFVTGGGRWMWIGGLWTLEIFDLDLFEISYVYNPAFEGTSLVIEKPGGKPRNLKRILELEKMRLFSR